MRANLFLGRLTLAFSLCISILFTQIGLNDSQAANSLQIDQACTSDETWNMGNYSTKYFHDKLNHPPGSLEEAIEQYAIASQTRKANLSKPGVKLLSEYFINRAYYGMNLVHLAYNGFNEMISAPPPPGANSLFLAGLNCLNQIHKE